jgi:hypothetical protein
MNLQAKVCSANRGNKDNAATPTLLDDTVQYRQNHLNSRREQLAIMKQAASCLEKCEDLSAKSDSNRQSIETLEHVRNRLNDYERLAKEVLNNLYPVSRYSGDLPQAAELITAITDKLPAISLNVSYSSEAIRALGEAKEKLTAFINYREETLKLIYPETKNWEYAPTHRDLIAEVEIKLKSLYEVKRELNKACSKEQVALRGCIHKLEPVYMSHSINLSMLRVHIAAKEEEVSRLEAGLVDSANILNKRS